MTRATPTAARASGQNRLPWLISTQRALRALSACRQTRATPSAMTSSGHTARLAAPRLRLSMRMPVPDGQRDQRHDLALSGRLPASQDRASRGSFAPATPRYPAGRKNQKDA